MTKNIYLLPLKKFQILSFWIYTLDLLSWSPTASFKVCTIKTVPNTKIHCTQHTFVKMHTAELTSWNYLLLNSWIILEIKRIFKLTCLLPNTKRRNNNELVLWNLFHCCVNIQWPLCIYNNICWRDKTEDILETGCQR